MSPARRRDRAGSGAALLDWARPACAALGVALAAVNCSVAQAQSVAVIANVEGEVHFTHAVATAPATMLQLVSADSALKLASGGKVVLLYLTTGHEYTMLGPATARIDATALTVIDGKAATLRIPPPEKAVKLRPERIVQAGMVMRAGPASAPAAPMTGEVTPGHIESRRPPPRAPIEERVAFALWLEDIGAMTEAKAVWRELAAERPKQEALASRAR